MQDYSITSQSKGKHLTNQDRLNIERWHNKEGLSNREIARLLNKAHGTIDREMKRGLTVFVRVNSRLRLIVM